MPSRIRTNDPNSSPKMRGKRLRTLRMMTGLSREAFAEKYGISASTIQSWEAAKAGGLTSKGANRMIPVFLDEGIRCTVDWLLYGIGNPPQQSNWHYQQELREPAAPTTYNITDQDAIIAQELLRYRELNPDVIDYVIVDDGMSPHYIAGDYVAGSRRRKDEIYTLLGMDCIVETKNNEILLRRLKQGSRPGLYTLISSNLDSELQFPVLYDQELISAAPVTWHRRRDPKKA